MEIFTLRDLDRSATKVLAAADRDGVARVRSGDGRVYSVTPYKSPAKKQSWTKFIQARRRSIAQLSMPQISITEAASLDRLIAGE